MISTIHALTLAWPIRNCTCLSNQLHHRHRRGCTAVDPDDRDRAAPPKVEIAAWRTEVRFDLLHQFGGDRGGVREASVWIASCTGAPGLLFRLHQ
jgi:hypothetical protein